MAVTQHPEVLEWLQGALGEELKRLPWAVTNPALSQGRAQALTEIVEFAKQSPAIAAKL
jgi:hypothetical protein